MHQHPDDYEHEGLDRYHDEDEEDLEELGTPLYQGSGLSVRALTAEELQRFLDAHHDQPAQLLGRGWTALDPLGHPVGGPRTPPAATLPVVPAGTPSGSLGSPGRSALAAAQRRRREELAAWTRTLVWRAPLVAAAGLSGDVLAAQAGLPWAGLVGLAAAALLGWRLRFRPSEQVTAWRRGAADERRTARLLDRLVRDGYVVFHDLAIRHGPPVGFQVTDVGKHPRRRGLVASLSSRLQRDVVVGLGPGRLAQIKEHGSSHPGQLGGNGVEPTTFSSRL
jgi:hypothetical protein